MADLFRDSTLGQIIRYVTGKRVLKYVEERPGFVLPPGYRDGKSSQTTMVPTPAGDELVDPETGSRIKAGSQRHKQEDHVENEPIHQGHLPLTIEGRFEAELERSLSKVGSVPKIPEHLDDDTILVDWYTSDDPENPQNWSQVKKAVVVSIIYFYTFSVYIGSAIYSPSEAGVMQEFGVSETSASLPLSLYVLGYGVGPLLFSPLSEVPVLGRNTPYILTFTIFVILCVPTALVKNFAGLLVLRFLQGFFGSPALATGGASIQDVYSLLKLPYALTFWLASAYGGPAIGPVIAGFAVSAESWRWALWEMLWIAAPVLIFMILLLPETSADTILLKRTRRLRLLTSDMRLKSQSEINQGHMSLGSVVRESLLVPLKIAVLDPAVLFANGYTCLCYGIYYSFFEAFPLVYMKIYGFNLGQLGLVFLSIIVACILGVISYMAYVWFVLEPKIRRHGMGQPEERLFAALFASFVAPVGLFLFAWAANVHVHWIVSAIGITLYTWANFVLVQCVFVYIPLTYPKYAASLFAGNDMCRSSLACGSILFGTPLFKNLGIGPGVSLLAGLTVGCIAGMFYLYANGAKLRAKSKFAVKW